MAFEKTIGTRAQVWHGTAKKTPGGLLKKQLMMNKHGRIVSRKKHNIAKKEKRLVKAGYVAKKGEFKLFHKGHTKKHNKKGGSDKSDSDYPENELLHSALIAGNKAEYPEDETHHTALIAGKKNKTRKMRGGMAYGGPLKPQSYH